MDVLYRDYLLGTNNFKSTSIRRDTSRVMFFVHRVILDSDAVDREVTETHHELLI